MKNDKLLEALGLAIQAMNNVPSFGTGIPEYPTSYKLLPMLEAAVKDKLLKPKAKTAKTAKRLVNYVNRFGKCIYRAKNMQSIIEARTRGEFKPVPDWLPVYMQNLPRALELAARINAPCPKNRDDWYDEDGKATPARAAYLEAFEVHKADVENAKASERELKRHIFGSARG